MTLPKLCLLALLGTSGAAAQAVPRLTAPDAVDSTVIQFLAQAREGSARYHDQREAIAAGYRRLGPDFPSMGEHWVHPLLVLQGRLDPAEPQVLSYARIGERSTLVGVAYATPLSPGEAPPAFPPGGIWHDHTGTIDEESILLHQTVSGLHDGQGVRLAMLHVWIGLENPAGPFVSDNWALPFARLGLVPGPGASMKSARALSLASGGDSYYLQLLQTLGQPSAREDSVARRVLGQARGRVVEWLRQRDDGGVQPSTHELHFLSSLWDDAWVEIGRNVRPEVAARFQVIRAAEAFPPHAGHVQPSPRD